VTKTFVGPQLRQLRRERRQTQAEMAKVLGVSPGYVNLLENNERSLSLRVLIALADHYGVDWRDIVSDKTSNLLAELRSIIKDPMFDVAEDLVDTNSILVNGQPLRRANNRRSNEAAIIEISLKLVASLAAQRDAGQRSLRRLQKIGRLRVLEI